MVKVESIAKRLIKVENSLQILGSLQSYKYADFIANPLVYASSERFLHLSIEALMDIGGHIIADLQLGTVHWASDIPTILQQRGYLDDRQKVFFIKMIGFRNTLVHEYIEIDRGIVFDILQNNLDDIRELVRIFAGFI